jgi:phage/plasmid primase-like uncharacterized protein
MIPFSVTFNQALAAEGLPQHGNPIADDRIHRFASPPDKEPNSWYVLHLRGDLIVGAFGCWRRNFWKPFCSKDRATMTPDERRIADQTIRECKAQIAAEEKAGQEKAQAKCRTLFSQSPRATAHAYLTAKGISASPSTALSTDPLYPGWLAVPLQDAEGVIHSAQFIADDGTKKFLYQGRVKGCYHQFSDVNHGGPILICEGYATGASLYLSTGWSTICAMNCGNLEPVAKSFRTRFPDRTLLIAADNDQFTPDNPGLTHGKAAARAARALLSFPEFADEALAEKPTDFNDLHRLAGVREVKRQIHQSFPVLKLLSEREFNPSARPPPEEPIFKLKDITIATPENISTTTAAIKSGKSAAIESMAASTFAAQDCDTLSFASANPDGKALLHFDSEQSPADHWHHVDRIIRRAHAGQKPTWLKSYCLTGLTFKQCQECVWEAVRIAAEEFPGILAVLIDGYADLVSDVNDSAESNDLVARIHGLAIQYHCHISGIIHLNPGSEKSRGHLGSQLERKAETNLQMEKDKAEESSIIFSTKNRRAGIPKSLGIAFQWDEDSKMHVSCDPPSHPKSKMGRPSILSQILTMNTHEFLAACPSAGECRAEISKRLEAWLASQSIDACTKTCSNAIPLLVASKKLSKDPSSRLYLIGPNA